MKRTKENPQQREASKTTVHPEMQRVQKGRVPDDKSSKAHSDSSGDGRTAQDKDGNAEQARRSGRS